MCSSLKTSPDSTTFCVDSEDYCPVLTIEPLTDKDIVGHNSLGSMRKP